MAKITQRAAIIAYFQSKPEMRKDLNSRSQRFVVYNSLTTGVNYYIGKAGALRKGKTAASSVPVIDALKSAVISSGTHILRNMD